jgi:hypothetical protein
MASLGDGRGTLSMRTAAPAVRITGIKVPATVLDETCLPVREHLPLLTVFYLFLSSTVSFCQFLGLLTTFEPIAPSSY